METRTADVIRTMYWHSHNADGTVRDDHCCGCWNAVHDERGLRLECNECGEARDLTTLVDPDNTAQPFPSQES